MTNYETLKRHLEQKLIGYLDKYLKKDFHMNHVFENIKKTLSAREEISEKQFQSIIKFLEREREWRGETRGKIHMYFSPVITNNRKETSTATLEEFLN